LKKYNKTNQEVSKLITKNYSTSFYTASLIFPPTIRKAIFSIYGFVRFADEIVDTFHDYNKAELLNKFEQDLKLSINEGISLNPVLHSFVMVIKEYNIDYHLIDAFMESMRKDLSINKYSTTSEINEYIYGSAEVVGLMCLKVFCKGNNKQYNSLKDSAKNLGAAFQKVNFIRDLNEDINELNRTYFPNIKNNTFDENTKSQIIKDIENDFSQAYEGIKKLPKNSKTAVYIAFLYYKQLLKKIKKTPANIILKKRIRVPNYHKFLILKKGVFLCKLNLIK